MNAVQTPMTHGLLSGLSVLKPNKMKELFATRGLQGGDLFLTIKALGYEKEVDQDSYSHWQEDFILANFQSRNAVTGQGAGDSVNITLDQNSVDASNHFYPEVYDVILFGTPGARVPGIITAINVSSPAAPVLTVEPKLITDTIPDIDADEYLFIVTNSWAEGSDQPDGKISGVTEYTNYLTESKQSVSTTGSALTDSLWFDIPWTSIKSDAPAGSYYRKVLVDLDHRMSQAIGGALQFDVPTTNTAAVDAVEGTLLPGTLGFYPAIEAYGYVDPITPGGMTIGDFDTYGKIFVRENVTNPEIMGWMGYDLYVEIENLLPDFLDNTNVDYTMKRVADNYFGKNMDMAVSIGFSAFTKSGKTYLFKINYDFSNQKTFGTTGYNYGYMAAFIPMGKSKDARTGDMVGSIGYRYKKLGNYNREFEMWDEGTANVPVKTGRKDKRYTFCRSNYGAQQIGAHRFIALEP
jgi:hypothetical protein